MREERILQILDSIYFIGTMGKVEEMTQESLLWFKAKLEAMTEEELIETSFKIMEISTKTLKKLTEIETKRKKDLNGVLESEEELRAKEDAVTELSMMF